MSNYTVSSHWLFSNINNNNIIVLDASIKPVTGMANNIDAIIPKAKRFDLKNVFSDKESKYDHMLPKPNMFINELQKLGINEDSVVVVYDNQGVYSSPRAWFMIKDIGHKEVYVLDGGLPKWIENGFSTCTEYTNVAVTGNISVKDKPRFFCDANYLQEHYNDNGCNVIDARSEGRFLGLEPEPREGLKSGHIPGSVSLSFNKVIKDGAFLDNRELKAMFSGLADINQELIFSCGSGITSCIPAMAALIAGYNNIKVYDGSWSEWGDTQNNYPVTLN
ncbi:sulfurtransferase [Flavobacterium rakeshii]|uniref:Sulfurtransferase n=1 Tax=Flavobacterium rakeshii TaxID=1038845 RepID=A0A6N8HDH8_9FLAO|nr:sulfurtransferase [Flavobacterium rakeshii]MUV03755.1 sulfurtransferase [Flavobacterium rakeshii]